MKAHKAVVKGTDILVFNEAGVLMETVPATREFIAQFYAYKVQTRQWEDEILEVWTHSGREVPEPNWEECRKNIAEFIQRNWSY